jgi:hypothetical protein
MKTLWSYITDIILLAAIAASLVYMVKGCF